MALTEELPIYRATYRLLNMLIRATQDFPRFYKYSLGTRMVDVCLDMSMLIYKANSSYEKVELIREFFIPVQYVADVTSGMCRTKGDRY